MSDDTHTPDDDDLEDLGPEIVTLLNDEGEEFDFAFLGVLEMDGEEFGILADAEQYADPSTDNLEIYTFRYAEDDEGNRIFDAIEDDALAARVFEAAVIALRDGGEE